MYIESFRAKISGNGFKDANAAIEYATGEKNWYEDEDSWQTAQINGFAEIKDGYLIVYSDGI